MPSWVKDDPETILGLWLNIGRVRRQAAAAVMDGMTAAQSDEQLPFDWFDGIALVPEGADDLAYAANSDRWQSQKVAALGLRR